MNSVWLINIKDYTIKSIAVYKALMKPIAELMKSVEVGNKDVVTNVCESIEDIERK